VNDRRSFDDVHLSRDFAARVLAQAGTISRRRRQWWTAGVTTATVAGAVIAALWGIPSPRQFVQSPAAPVAQIPDADEFASANEAGTDPLQWMFPDAVPVAQFAGRYSAASAGGVEQRQQLLFADEMEGSRER
jgi:hypothetical protein